MISPTHSPLGKKTIYPNQYAPTLLFPISREKNRTEIGITAPLPFYGYDLWNHYEMSWLNAKGKPVVAVAEIIVPAESSHLIESKSLKLYFYSFNQAVFLDEKTLLACITKDLSHAAGAPVKINLIPLQQATINTHFDTLDGICLDDLDVQMDSYLPTPEILTTDPTIITESVHSHLLRSNCPITNQPDWGSIQITYAGPKINHVNLLKYLVSLRNHNEFHEQCVERIFMNIQTRCKPTALTVYARYTRRGGLDINPYRSTHPIFSIKNPRLIRQ